MRKIFPLLSLLVIFLTGTSCHNSDIEETKDETITVSLNIDEDFDINVEQNTITKAGSSNDAYGINVYYDKEGDGRIDDIYAYGLFDNINDMIITLLSNHKYKVSCNLVKNARNTLFYGQAFNNTYSGYAYPFQTNSSNSTLISNKFVLGTSTYFTGFSSGNAHLASTSSPSTYNSTVCASINRFYGETDQYVPVPNGTIDVYLKRVVFGAKFVVSGLQEGSVTVKCGDFYSKNYTNNEVGKETLYTFPDVYDTWKNESTLAADLSIRYVSDRGSLWHLSQSQKVQFKRNVMTTVNIKLNPDLSGASVSLAEEEIGEDNNINLGINTDGLIDIIVNPEN